MAKENNNTAFKSTPIGMIPIDWDIIQIGEVGTLFKGKGIAKTEVVEEGLPCIRYAELYTKYNTKFTNTFSFCNEESALLSQKIINGDIVFAGSGETLEDIGKCAVYLGDSVAYAGGDTIILRPEKVDSTYLSYLLNYDSVVKQRSVLGQGNSVVHIYPKGIATILVQIPPTKEQTKIAQILSTWDVSIETLQLLITKKERRKKALMQKLLTGKIRFKEFKGEKWKKKEIGMLLDYEQPNKYTTENILENSDSKIPVLTANKGFILGYTTDTSGIYSNTPVIIFDDFTTDTKYVDFDFKIRSSAIKLLKPKTNDVNLRFVFERMQLFQINLAEHKRRYISEYQFNLIMIPSIKEQNKIASVLSAADEEIQTLKTSLAHYKQQKQGLMQVLLTGKKRVKI